jgi:YidC/Oxa1 family membrane protein insertase
MSAKQYRDTKKVRSIQPRLEELKAKFKDKPTELAKAQQNLYKEINYNPLGCLTNFIIQIPIVIALYQSVLAFTKSGVTPATMPGLYPFVAEKLAAMGQSQFATDLFGIQLMSSPGSHFAQGFFTVEALPYLVLLLVLGLSNVLPALINMKVMNTQVPKIRKKDEKKTDEEAMQEAFASSLNNSTIYIMPLMLTVSMSPLPSLVAVYMIAQNIVSTTQQYSIKLLHDKQLQKKLAIRLQDKQFELAKEDAVKTATQLTKLPAAINYLVDELAEFGEMKTLSAKIHDVTMSTVLKKCKGNQVEALLLFEKMAKNPEKAEEMLRA